MCSKEDLVRDWLYLPVPRFGFREIRVKRNPQSLIQFCRFLFEEQCLIAFNTNRTKKTIDVPFQNLGGKIRGQSTGKAYYSIQSLSN